MYRRVAVTAHAVVRDPGPPEVSLTAPDWHTLAWGIDARVSMDTRTLQATYLALGAYLAKWGELPADQTLGRAS